MDRDGLVLGSSILGNIEDIGKWERERRDRVVRLARLSLVSAMPRVSSLVEHGKGREGCVRVRVSS